jgi:uncharacterized caspase-like protein
MRELFRNRLFLPSVLLVGVVLAPFAASLAEPPAGKKVALLVGVKNYIPGQLGNLRYTENDVEDLAGVLKEQAGFSRVVVMTQARGVTKPELNPTLDNITEHLKSMLEMTRKGDAILLAFSGHGTLRPVKDKTGKQADESFFCPADARLKAGKNLLALAEVYEQLQQSKASVKLLLVDACRDDPEGKGGGSDEFNPTRPADDSGIAAFFSCAKGQRSFESDELKRGVFFHYLIEGLKGQGANKKNEVTLDSLADFVKGEVPDRVKGGEEVGAGQAVPQPGWRHREGHAGALGGAAEDARGQDSEHGVCADPGGHVPDGLAGFGQAGPRRREAAA